MFSIFLGPQPDLQSTPVMHQPSVAVNETNHRQQQARAQSQRDRVVNVGENASEHGERESSGRGGLARVTSRKRGRSPSVVRESEGEPHENSQFLRKIIFSRF